MPLFDKPEKPSADRETFCPIKLTEPAVESQDAKQPKCTMPPVFTGKDWYQYLIQFENIAIANGWDDSTKKKVLISKCQGDPATALSGIELDSATFADMVILLCKMYGVGTPEEREQKFKTRKQHPGENHQTFALKLRTLALWAFPHASDETVNRQLIQQFITGLIDRKVAYEVHLRSPKTLFEATEIVSKILSSVKMIYGEDMSPESVGCVDDCSDEEGFDEDELQWVNAVMRGRRFNRNQFSRGENNSQTDRNKMMPMVCWWCGDKDHWIAKCVHYQDARDKWRKENGITDDDPKPKSQTTKQGSEN